MMRDTLIAPIAKPLPLRVLAVPVALVRAITGIARDAVAAVLPAPQKKVALQFVPGLRVEANAIPDHALWVDAAERNLSPREAELMRHAAAVDRAQEAPPRAALHN